MTSSARSPLAVAAWLCLLAALVYLLSYAGVLHAVDEQSALSVTESMLLGQGFHTNQMEWDQARTPPQNAFGLDGNLYSKKGIGVSLLALPLFGLGETLPGAVGAVQAALLTGSLLTLAAVWAMFSLARSLGYRLRVAAAGALLLAFGSPLWPYARSLFSETPGAVGLALALWGMVAWRHSQPRRTAWLLLAGSGLALLVLMKSSNGVVAPIFGLYWLWGAWERRRSTGPGKFITELFALATPVLLAASATVAYNYVRFGTTLGFPLEPFEIFSTPLLVGLAGLLFSPGKGVFWYFPALWLAVAFASRWRRDGRLADFLLAAGATLALTAVYALWYDWPGGRAWGPRMIITATPALAMMVLPAIDWLLRGGTRTEAHKEHGPDAPAKPHAGVRTTRAPLGRFMVAAVLLLSVAVQLPGVLVNFERQEELDMQAGATFVQLLWSPAHAPLLTYWGRIATTPDPLWLQPYLHTLPPLLLASILAAAASAVCLAGGARQIWRRRRAGVWLGASALTLALLACLLPPLAYADPRWDDQSAVREDNRAVMHSIQEAWRPGDVVLLELQASSDMGRRTAQWLNFARREPYIGWLRKAEMGGEASERLGRWLSPYRRTWLLLQATDEGDGASTSEAWLNTWAYAGRRWWVGDQRVVEYLLPPSTTLTGAAETVGPFTFAGGPELERYQLVQDSFGDAAWLTLHWQAAGGADLRYSVQALDAANNVLAQVDGAPSASGSADHIGLALPVGVDRLILKLYLAGDGSVLPVTSPDSATAAADFLLLAAR